MKYTNNVSGEQLLDIYLRGRPSPVWKNTCHADAEIRCGEYRWKVHTEFLHERLPSLLVKYDPTVSNAIYTVFTCDDDPVVLNTLIFWIYTTRPPKTTPLQHSQHWSQTIRLWSIAHKYHAFGLMRDLSAIILSSLPPYGESAAVLTKVITILTEVDCDFHIQRDYFMKRLMWGVSPRLRAGELDTVLLTIQHAVPLDGKVLEESSGFAKAVYRSRYFFYWTKSLLP